MYDIAACIVTHRSSFEQLRHTVESFLAQPIQGHLTIVDNASGSVYLDQLRRLGGVHLIESATNGGYGFGHNIGMKDAPPHRYYLILNPDVVIHDNTLKVMVDYMDTQPDVAMLVPKVLHPNGELQPLNKRLPNVADFFIRRFAPKFIQNLPMISKRLDRYEMRDVGYEKICEVPFPSGCFMLCRPAALQHIGGFDERFFMYLEDCDLGRRISEHGRIIYLPESVITHHWTRGAHHSLRLTWQFTLSMYRYFNKWGWKWA